MFWALSWEFGLMDFLSLKRLTFFRRKCIIRIDEKERIFMFNIDEELATKFKELKFAAHFGKYC